jgi:hypothetical protein
MTPTHEPSTLTITNPSQSTHSCRLHQNFRAAWEAAERFPHYANALKYAVPFLLSGFAIYNPKVTN